MFSEDMVLDVFVRKGHGEIGEKYHAILRGLTGFDVKKQGIRRIAFATMPTSGTISERKTGLG